MKLSEMPVFFLDLQTTGANPSKGDLLEIAWAAGECPPRRHLLRLPAGKDLPRPIQMLTGLRPSDLDNAIPVETAFAELENFQHEHAGPAVIHFASFEKLFLQDAYEKMQRPRPFDILCTHEIAKRLLPNLPTRGIKGLAGYFGYPPGDLKRAGAYVEATRWIWRGLISLLEKENIRTVDDLTVWLQTTSKKVRTKYEYPMAKEKRLSLPSRPGVYRMISKTGSVLYVGKATCLKDRVNSYFRGQKNRDPRKLEMLTQAWDLQVTVCESILEASLLETDEIKRLDPPYNISLKTGRRQICFFDRDFMLPQFFQDERHRWGPFSNSQVFESLQNLVRALQEKTFSEFIFYEPFPAALIEEGYHLFCERHGFSSEKFSSMRAILAVGLKWYRQQARENPESDDVENEEVPESLEEEVRAEDLADKFERHFVRAGYAFVRARGLTRLLNADIDFEGIPGGPLRHLQIRQGRIASRSETAISEKSVLSLDVYDRMSVLSTELEKIRQRQGTLKIQPRAWDERSL